MFNKGRAGSGSNYTDTGDGGSNNIMLIVEVVVVIEIHYITTCQKLKIESMPD